MAKPEAAPPVTQRQTVWLAATALGAFLPLAPWLPGWLNALCLTGIVWRGWLLWRRIPLPPGWLLNLLAVAGIAGIGLHFRNLFGKDPGVAMLALFLALKLFETRTLRDATGVVLLCFFLILSQFFYTQSIATAALMLVSVTLATSTLIALQREDVAPRAALRLGGSLLLQALPFMLLLFLLFPRVSGPLWGLPADAGRGLSGLSDNMSPGSISNLSLSEAIAFRARFDGKLPNKGELYWRGPVLNNFDGRTWRMGPPRKNAADGVADKGDAVQYEITLEPHNQPWLLALDYPQRWPADALLTSTWQVVAQKVVRSRQRYTLRSVPSARIGLEEPAYAKREALQLPSTGNPRSRELAQALRARSPNDLALANAFLGRIREQNFVYTLTPPLLGVDTVDEFLFDTRRGFCEHYAAAFVFVMRAAGVPARVVTGYQGGELNPVDGYLTVRQSDAHAWAEIWLAGEGWRRVDPTAAIAPARVENNLAAAVPRGDPIALLARPELDWLRSARYRWEAVSNAWNQWVLGYDNQRQMALLQRLGLESPDWRTLGALMAGLGGTLMLALAAWTLNQRQRIDPLLRQWRRFESKLVRAGFVLHPWEGPRDLAARAAQALPRQSEEIAAICDLYAAMRYGRVIDDQPLDELTRRIAAFAR
ncbi:MAG TPA: DUF3488 and DUF4129 domain-containing transglutaminase family protein [Rhodocyclaceae bacterium]